MKLYFSSRHGVPLIRQNEAAECGIACIAMVAAFHGFETDLPALRRRFPISLKGTSLKVMTVVADRIGLAARPVRMDMEDFNEGLLPLIIHWDMRHFVVVTRIRVRRGGRVFEIHNPATGRIEMSEAEVAKHFTGVALELQPTVVFKPNREARRLRISQLWTHMSGFGASMGQLLMLSLILQLITLGMPLFMQTVIDSVLPSFDADLLLTLALGFSGVILIRALSEVLRGYVQLNLGNALSYQMVVNLFRHLMRLPLPWFEKRHVGDIVSRFGSTQAVSNALTSGVLGSVIDGLLAFATLALMFIYSVPLSLLAIMAVTLLTLAQWGYYQVLKGLNAGSIAAQAAEQSSFMESVRGIAAIKAFGLESARQLVWQNKKVQATNATMKLGRLSSMLGALRTLILGIETVLFTYVAARLALNAKITIGMIFAFQAYRQQFIDAANRLIQVYTDFRMLDVHLSRISDIALTAPEPEEQFGLEQASISGAIAVQGLRFSYGMGEPDILRNVSFEIRQGETVALVGPSGGGKTTLLKLLMGLLYPVQGEVLVDGKRLAVYGRRDYRQQIGSVAQDDVLFAGTVAENIAFFDPDIDMKKVQSAAQQAAIHDDIKAMPMQYESLVGDMGTTLSGGQKQRVLLARALYRQPAILFLDEGTAHLDYQTEALVNASVRNLAMTRIIVAHRRETIATADRIFLVSDRGVVEQSAPTIVKPNMTADSFGSNDAIEIQA